jgi:hypothetical protein
MNPFVVPRREVEAVQLMLAEVAPDSEVLLKNARAAVTIESPGEGPPSDVVLKCSDQFLEVVWTALKDHPADVSPEASYNGILVGELVECVEAWMIKWSDSNLATP